MLPGAPWSAAASLCFWDPRRMPESRSDTLNGHSLQIIHPLTLNVREGKACYFSSSSKQPFLDFTANETLPRDQQLLASGGCYSIYPAEMLPGRCMCFKAGLWGVVPCRCIHPLLLSGCVACRTLHKKAGFEGHTENTG